MSSPVKIVVVAPTWLGDSVMSLPLVGYLAASESVRVTVVSRSSVSRVYIGIDGLSDVVALGENG